MPNYFDFEKGHVQKVNFLQLLLIFLNRVKLFFVVNYIVNKEEIEIVMIQIQNASRK